MDRGKFSRIRVATHVVALLPLIYLVWAYFTDQLGFNPIRAATLRTGHFTLVLLILSLACTPLARLSGAHQLVKLRRPLGLYAFIYASIHLLIFAGWDYGFDWALIRQFTLEKKFVLAGLAAFLILLVLALTSSRWAMRRLGRWWKRIHRAVYLASCLAVLHYAWALKADFTLLGEDSWKPMAYGIALVVLLLLRIPGVGKLRSRFDSGSNLPQT